MAIVPREAGESGHLACQGVDGVDMGRPGVSDRNRDRNIGDSRQLVVETDDGGFAEDLS